MSFLVGFVFIAIGCAGIYFVNRRVFYRINAAGVEEFDGHASMLATRFVEKIIKVASGCSFLFGGFMLLVGIISIYR